MNSIFENIARRAFEIFEGNGRMFGHDLDNWFQAERELLHPLNLELAETEAAFELKAEVAGLQRKRAGSQRGAAPRRNRRQARNQV